MPRLEEVLDLYITFAQAHPGPSDDINPKVFLDQLETKKEKKEFKRLVVKANLLIMLERRIHLKINGLPSPNISLDVIIGVSA